MIDKGENPEDIKLSPFEQEVLILEVPSPLTRAMWMMKFTINLPTFHRKGNGAADRFCGTNDSDEYFQ